MFAFARKSWKACSFQVCLLIFLFIHLCSFRTCCVHVLSGMYINYEVPRALTAGSHSRASDEAQALTVSQVCFDK
jgi:hypothetical protein